MATEQRAKRYLRRLIIGAGLAVPTLSLIPFGSYWLWQNGYLLYWGLAAAATTSLAFLYQRRMLQPRPTEKAKAVDPDDLPSGHWSPGEQQAWAGVIELSDRSEPKHLSSRDEAINLGLRTVETVARRLHPDVDDPLWQFTVPEALALVESVSTRLRPMIVDNVPLGDRLTVAQLLDLYKWRGALDVANRAYDVWRVVRLVNPVAAATQEARERLTKQMLDWGKDQVTRRIVKAYVREVGRAAIDLYGGRLSIETKGPVTALNGVDVGDGEVRRRARPLHLVLTGRDPDRLTRLLHALATDSRFYTTTTYADGHDAVEVERDGISEPIVIAIATLDEARSRAALPPQLEHADIVVATGPEVDRTVALANARLADHFARRQHLAAPVLVAAVDDGAPVENSSTASRAALAGALGLPESRVAMLPDGGADYGPAAAAAVWSVVEGVRCDGKRVQLLRALADAKSERGWGRVFRQIGNAGRSIYSQALDRDAPR